MFEKIQFCLEKLKKDNPIVLNLTNYVTMDIMSNALLAIGAAPIMSAEENELEELISIASAVNINLGTLNQGFFQQATKTAEYALFKNKPIILDPVGAGASKIRTQSALDLLPKCNIVRGNASEIISLCDHNAKTRGVESNHSTLEAHDISKQLLNHYNNLVIVISGNIDHVVLKQKNASLHFGTPLMKLVTGMGCTLTAIIAAFYAVYDDPFEASILATSFYGLCGQQAERESDLPGSFRQAFINALYAPDLNFMKQKIMPPL